MAGRTATATIAEAQNGYAPASVVVHNECLYAAGLTEAADSTVVYNGPCVLYGLWVTAAFSANACPIQDNATAIFAIPASAALGTYYSFPFGIRFETSLIVDPVDVGTGGVVTVFYRPI